MCLYLRSAQAARPALSLFIWMLAVVALAGCSGSNAAYGPTRLLVAGQEVQSLPEAPGDTERLAALVEDLDQLEQQLDLAPLTEDERPVAMFTLGSRLSGLSAAYQRRPTHHATQLALARVYWLMGRCERVGAFHLASALFDDLAANPEVDASTRATAHLYRAKVALALQQPARAEAALEDAVQAADDMPQAAATALLQDLPLLRARLQVAQHQPEEAIALLSAYVQGRPDNMAAVRQLDQWRTLSPGALSVTAATGALATYALRPPTHWTLTHETLGVAMDIPLDWLISDEQVQPDTSGSLQLTGPPYVGPDRQWRAAEATVWVVPLQPGEDVAGLITAYSASFPPEVQAQRLDADAGRAVLRLDSMQGQAPWRGQALLLSDGQMGYVLEVWAEADRFAEVLSQTDLLWSSFRPSSPLVSGVHAGMETTQRPR
jgi:hypothetical protein